MMLDILNAIQRFQDADSAEEIEFWESWFYEELHQHFGELAQDVVELIRSANITALLDLCEA